MEVNRNFLGTIPIYRYLSLFAICYRWSPYLTYSVDYFIIKSSWSWTQWCSAQESSLYFASNTFLSFMLQTDTHHKVEIFSTWICIIINHSQYANIYLFYVPIASGLQQLSVRKGYQLWESEIKSLLVYKLCNCIA